MEKWLDDLRTDLESCGLAVGTRYSYARHIQLFLEHGGRPPADLHARDIEDHLDRLAEEGKPLSYRRHALTALRFFCNVTLQRPEATAPVLTPFETAMVPDPLSPERLDDFFRSVHSPVYRAVMETALGDGMSIAETSRLTPQNIESVRGLVRLPQQRPWPQYVPLDRFTLAGLRAWWREARPQTPLLFALGDGEPVRVGRVQQAMRTAWRDVGLAKPFDERALRYSFFLKRLREGAEPGEVMHLLRLTSIRHVPAAFLQRQASVHAASSAIREGAQP